MRFKLQVLCVLHMCFWIFHGVDSDSRYFSIDIQVETKGGLLETKQVMGALRSNFCFLLKEANLK